MIQRKIALFLPLLLAAMQISAQQGFSQTDPDRQLKEIAAWVNSGQYALAYPAARELNGAYQREKSGADEFFKEDIRFFELVCRLRLDMESASADAAIFINHCRQPARKQQLAFHAGHYHYSRDEYEEAVQFYRLAGYDNLSNEQIADAKFELAYSHFNLKQFSDAKPLFNEIHQFSDHKYYYPASYYYGFIAYYDKEFDEALKAFKLVEEREEYKGVVPYYIAEIYYFRGDKESAIAYGEKALAAGNNLFYYDQLRLLLGQLYFEKQDYKKSVPLLEAYLNNNPKVSKEVLYELSYSYYKTGMNAKAMEGFKQLSSEKDSMGQNSMYLLGDLYLKAGQKENARNAFQYAAYNSSNLQQQRVSRFQYAKLSYELGYQDVAMKEMKDYLRDYPTSEYDAEGREILIGMLGSSNNYAEALELYDSYKTPTPAMKQTLPRIRFGRAVELINQQQTAEAMVLLQQITSDPLSGNVAPYAYFWLGELEYRNGNYDASIKHMRKFKEFNPSAQGEANLPSANYTLGYACFQKADYKQSSAAFGEVTKSISSKSSALMQDAFSRMADCYYLMREFEKASAMYDQVIAAGSPQSDNALFQKAMIAGIKNGMEKIRMLRSISQKYPNSSLLQEANMEIGLTYMVEERFSEAIPFFNAVLNGDEGSLKPKAYLKSGTAYFNDNNNKDALRSFNELFEKYPNSQEADEALGLVKNIYVEEGRTDDYVDMMKLKGINITVTEADSLSFVAGESKFSAEDCKGAITSFDNYLRKYPSGAFMLDALYMKGECYRKAGDWTKALEAYSKVSQSGPSKYYEKATLEAARINYFETKDYAAALLSFSALVSQAASPEVKLEGLRGAVRSYFLLKDYSGGMTLARELIADKGASTDDKAVAGLLVGRSQQLANDCGAAIASFRTVALASKSAWGAEARYQMAVCHFQSNDLSSSENAALSVIKETGGYDEWVTRSYILLGDIFLSQEDYFNAKATYESVARNAGISSLKEEASAKLEQAIIAENKKSRISKP
jgi:TolA-binding protein